MKVHIASRLTIAELAIQSVAWDRADGTFSCRHRNADGTIGDRSTAYGDLLIWARDNVNGLGVTTVIEVADERAVDTLLGRRWDDVIDEHPEAAPLIRKRDKIRPLHSRLGWSWQSEGLLGGRRGRR